MEVRVVVLVKRPAQDLGGLWCKRRISFYELEISAVDGDKRGGQADWFVFVSGDGGAEPQAEYYCGGNEETFRFWADTALSAGAGSSFFRF